MGNGAGGGHGAPGALTDDGELIDLIYAALLGEAPWQRFLDRLADSAPSGKTVLVMHDNGKSNGYIPLASGIPSDVLGNYNGYFATVNPFMGPASIKPVGVGLVDEELVPNAELVQSEFFNDLLKPHEMPERVALTINRERGYQFVLASLGDAFDHECKHNIADQLTRLYPHLRRASDYYRKSPASRAATELGCSLFDAIDIGVVVVGDSGRMKALSKTGELMLSKSSAIRVSPIGIVSLRDPKAQSVMADMVTRVYAGPKVVRVATKGTNLTLIRVQRDQISLFFDGPTVVVLMNLPAHEQNLASETIAETYGLSKAEMRVVLGLIDGRSVAQIAETAKVSEGTVRQQLKSVYSKTGTHRQVELAHLVWFGKRYHDDI
jgi:DNA-binding CsgD family transcriptional regulator